MAVAFDLASYDPLDSARLQDPYPAYAALRRQAPVFRHPATGLYFVSRHAAVKRILEDTETFSSRVASAATRPKGQGSPEVAAELAAIAEQTASPTDTLLTADPPRQTRYRKAMGRDFTQRVAALEAPIRAISRDLIDPWPARGTVDFMNAYAVPFPVRAIACALAMKSGLEADIKRWSDDSVAGLGQTITPERRLEAARGVLELQRYWIGQVEDRRAHPRDDYVSDLTRAWFEEPGGARRRLHVPEAISILQQLMVAGNETTTKLLNETMKLLAQHPEQWRRLREEPSRIPSVVEEALRMATPNQGLFRQVRADTEVDGVAIPAGARVWVMFGSANRDEAVFPDPDRFDPDRPNLREHLAFGHGAHFCIGAPLARLEARVALEEISRSVADIRIAAGESLAYESSFILRGLASLRLDVTRA